MLTIMSHGSQVEDGTVTNFLPEASKLIQDKNGQYLTKINSIYLNKGSRNSIFSEFSKFLSFRDDTLTNFRPEASTLIQDKNGQNWAEMNSISLQSNSSHNFIVSRNEPPFLIIRRSPKGARADIGN
ncbi:hypothetical protein CDAR_54841 [Caerostris darwini]|uniref:Uncharacterized protein n=1 Tax=Caerostris darwini TaxID=1538125 RepID=A0AAV4ND33_9ARAC|nr:hypothetical protein CDAR_54841 [Caerostris darwini]